MKVRDLNFSYDDLLTVLDHKYTIQLVHHKLTGVRFLKSTDRAEKEGITRSAMSQRIKDNPEKYETVEFAGCLYVRDVKGGKK